MRDKSKIIAIILALVALIIVISNLFIKEEVKQEKEKINIVTDYSSFYTINSCLYRFVGHLYKEDADSVYLILSDTYKEKTNKEDVLKLFPNIEVDSTFVSKKMYYQQLNDNITKYYVEGYIEQEQILDDMQISKENINNIYFIVYLDKENKIFSIEPYDGDIFINGDLNEE